MIQKQSRVIGGPLHGEGVVLGLAGPEDQGPDVEQDPVLIVEEKPRTFLGRWLGHGVWYAIPSSMLKEVV